MVTPPDHRLELWGGIESTVARIGDRFRDQCLETGHRDRPDDLERIADLGIRTLRYPVLWETVAPDSPHVRDWRWHDERLNRLRDLGIRPIAGLVHHGSGPAYTNLLDPAFAEGLATHAEAVATRYPWIDLFTPVNEPLTTARFSGLYGHWFPHGRDDATFLRALTNQCRASVLAMRAIRRVTPAAQLVQTEDLGKTFSTPTLREQADYENERRWLSFDLLCGHVDRNHPWHEIMRRAGIDEADLDLVLSGDGAPDILGINHYPTSERYLDHRRNCYPRETWGGNGRDRYADVEAVRMPMAPGELGVEARLREASTRYGLPLAVTEVHHGCTREEQLRWLIEVWEAGCKLKTEGIDIRAVTIWSLFGAVDWNSLLTRDVGFYEPGAFDVRANPPRPTALAHAATSLVRTGRFDHPVLDVDGWWHRPDRFYHEASRPAARRSARPILILGGESALARTMGEICSVRGLEAVVIASGEHSIPLAGTLLDAVEGLRPWAVVDATRVPFGTAGVERDPSFEGSDGEERAPRLASLCARRAIPLVVFSSDAVFDGAAVGPYVESDPVTPATTLGQHQATAERRVLEDHPSSLILRSGPRLGFGAQSFLARTMRALAAGRPAFVSDTSLISPAFLPDLAHTTLDLLVDGECGIRHLASRDAISPYDLARRAAGIAGFGVSTLRRRSGRSRSQVLMSGQGFLLPPTVDVTERWARQATSSWRGS